VTKERLMSILIHVLKILPSETRREFLFALIDAVMDDAQ
jgi:hypothetical protein